MTAPEHLSRDSASWWETIASRYQLEPHHVRLLTLAAEAWDRHEQARRLLVAQGLVITDRYQKPKAHPAVAIERDSRLAFARLVRELGLDSEHVPEPRVPRVVV